MSAPRIRFGRIRHIHFVGVGGAGMSGLAELLVRQGYAVSGSDLAEGAAVSRLRDLGVEVSIGHDPVHVAAAEVVVLSSAIRPENPERVEAARRKIPIIGRAEMLAELMRLHDGVAVGGSHGKTTTTSLVAHLLDAAGLDPTAVIGGRVMGAGERSGARLGAGRVLVAEADESDGSFLRLRPVISVITNIDPEHLDHYGSHDRLRDAFVTFANGVPFWGLTVLCLDHPGVQSILPRITRRYATYGLSSQADWMASNLTPAAGGRGGMRFGLRAMGAAQGSVEIPLPGRHNVLNALAALAVAHELDVPLEVAVPALANFGGVERRFERKGAAGGITVVDDYAHHPAEIRATLAAARETGPKRIVAIFQPHRYTRTRDCMEEFATAWGDSDRLVVTEIYGAGDEPIPGVTGEALCEKIRAHGHRDAQFMATLDDVADQIVKDLRPGDLVLTLGAGDVSSLGPRLLERLGGGASS